MAETREAWLVQAILSMGHLFEAAEIEVPKVRVSVGFPGGPGRKDNVIGQCWSSSCTEDGIHHIFIHPKLKDPIEVLATLIHEVIHAVDDCQSGHRGPFVKMARAIGLAGKPTATVAGDELKESLNAILAEMPEYPHMPLSMVGGGAETPKKQGTRMIKIMCPNCEYSVRTTRKWIEIGLPTCPEGDEMEVQ